MNANTCFIRLPSDQKAQTSEDIGFRELRDDVVFDPEPAGDSGAIEGVVPARNDGPWMVVGGWARVLDPSEDPAVFVSLGDRKELFALASVIKVDGNRARWVADLPPFRKGTSVSAWLYDRRAGRLKRLSGRIEIAGK